MALPDNQEIQLTLASFQSFHLLLVTPSIYNPNEIGDYSSLGSWQQKVSLSSEFRVIFSLFVFAVLGVEPRVLYHCALSPALFIS